MIFIGSPSISNTLNRRNCACVRYSFAYCYLIKLLISMLTKLISSRLSFVTVYLRQLTMVQSNFNLGKEMKRLNDMKQFRKALQLFDQYNHNHNDNIIKECSSLFITQALKACAQIGDLHRGLIIHQLVPDYLKDDSYISTSLIHLYSECEQKFFSIYYCVM